MFKKSQILALLFSLLILGTSANAQKLKAEDVVAKHLASIAAPEAMTGVKSLIAAGEVRVEFLTQKNQPAMGRFVMASDGPKMFFGMKLNASDYPQEQVIFDGKKTFVAMVRAGTRSVLGNFLQSNSSVVSQGIFGGMLATTWTLLGGENQPKLSMRGSKKIDGRPAYGIAIVPKGGSDLDITMYFDEENFRHVRTEYSRTSSASMGQTIDQSARQSENRTKVTEDFSDFKDFKGFNIPSKYKIVYSLTGGSNTEVVWNIVINEFAVNQALDPSTFSVGN